MTSNVGSEHILEGHDELVKTELNKYFKPEFLNRVDEIIIFNKLTKEALYDILDKIIREIEARLKDLNIKINLDKSAKDYFIDNGYDEYYGARPLKRLVSKELETALAKEIIEGSIKNDETINVSYKDKLIIKVA